MILYSPQTPQPSYKGNYQRRRDESEPCVDWVIQCVLYHGVQVWIRLENLQTQN